ncbi:ubiquitin carboxyl-terminal hydrolase 10 isoform X3 [Cimex lectularius]|uniref:ubiquitinyl hydrolase 1 n=1 Tax=Cimex lectularius TaxID=79782 RepID=A0A8I6SBD4_CIMLE|nr:ubiquitin carboxyl-terminal hydrolase 10 isoform X3 [Cimex lectularius]
MDQSVQNLQFINLEEIESNEAELVQSLLYTLRSPKLELPWIEQEESQWNQQHHFDGEAEVYDGGGGNEVYHQMQVPPVAATTLSQMFHHTQVIPQMPNLTAYVQTPNLGYGLPPPPPMATYHPTPVYQEGRRPRAAKPSPKRNREGNYQPVTAAPTAYTTHQFPIPMSYQYLHQPPPAHIPTPQHATGHPLYMTQAIPLYHTAYNYPTTVFSTLQQPQQQQQMNVPQEDVKTTQPDFEKKPSQNQMCAKQEVKTVTHEQHPPPSNSPSNKSEDKPIKSLPINAIKTTSLPSMPPPTKRRSNEEQSTPQGSQPTQTPHTSPQQITQSQPPPSSASQPNIKSWAQITANKGSMDGEHHQQIPQQKLNTCKPPINAVVVSTPPRDLTNLPAPEPSQDKEDVDPQLRNLGEVLTNYTLDHKSIVLTPRGLKNPSNYCYINAILQALLACPAFYNLIKVISEVKHAVQKFPTMDRQTTTKNRTPIIDCMIQFIKEFTPAPVSKHGKRDKARKEKEESSCDMPPVGSPFEPTYIYKMLRALRSEDSFHEEGRQEDAEEFLSLLLNKLNDEMLELQKLFQDPKSPPVVNGEVTSNGDSHNEDDSVWKEVTTKGNRITRRAELERTPLSDIFRGQLRSSVHRPELSSSSDNVQPFFTLQLDIESSESVSEALEKLVGRYPVEGATPSQEVKMFQQQSLDQLPCVLILHLKCFHYRQQTPSKIVKALQFPIDLKLDQKLLSSKNQSAVKARQYKLFAVVYHDGKEATKGHYLTDVFYLGGGCPGWIRYDDALVTQIAESQVLHPSPPRVPYLLYYRRADTIGPQSNLVSKS